MNIAGIICEYNPFHRGHEWMMQQLREQGIDGIVCAMSGNFVQRGEFALLDKQSRAEMAVRCGADLVLSCPPPMPLLRRRCSRWAVRPCCIRPAW